MKTYKTILFFLIIYVPGYVFGQDVGKWMAGSAYKFSGQVYTVSCFVSGPDDGWKPEEKLGILKKQNEACNWLVGQAAKYKVSLSFGGESFGLSNDIKLLQIERGTASGNERVDWVSLVLGKIGYKSPLYLYKARMANAKWDNFQVIIYIKGNGIGYSMAYCYGMDADKYFVEGSVLYENYSDNVELTSASIAHEMLHLYGAWDLYKTFQQTQENEDKARKLFPNSIMLRVSNNINELEVDELTAWLAGWNNDPKAWYEPFRPQGD